MGSPVRLLNPSRFPSWTFVRTALRSLWVPRLNLVFYVRIYALRESVRYTYGSLANTCNFWRSGRFILAPALTFERRGRYGSSRARDMLGPTVGEALTRAGETALTAISRQKIKTTQNSIFIYTFSLFLIYNKSIFFCFFVFDDSYVVGGSNNMITSSDH